MAPLKNKFALLLSLILAPLPLLAKESLTLPLPLKDGLTSKEMTLTIKIPEEVKAVEQKVTKRKPVFPYWNRTPAPKIALTDEVYEILRRQIKLKTIKQWHYKKYLSQKVALEKVFLVGALKEAIQNLELIKESPDYKRLLRQSQMHATDVDDILRLQERFENELLNIGVMPKKAKDSLEGMVTDLKTMRTGMVRVVKVESAEDGTTVLHLNLE